jgi:N-acetylglucosamine-6-sulfatase
MLAKLKRALSHGMAVVVSACVVMAGCSLVDPLSVRYQPMDEAPVMAFSPTSPSGKPWNFVMVVLDDAVKWQMEDSTITPNMHRWVRDVGWSFDRYYSNSALCASARATMLSMLYQHNHHVIYNTGSQGGARVFDDAVTIITALAGVGWKPIGLAKYMNESGFLDGGAYVPPGWWHWQSQVLDSRTPNTTGMRYFGYKEAYKPGGSSATTATLIQHGNTPDEWQPRYFSSKLGPALANLPPGAPFFALVAPLGPHAPAVSEVMDWGQCNNKPLYRPASYNELDVSDQPLIVRQVALWSPARQAVQDSAIRVACETLMGTDRAIGAMMQDLEDGGWLANTCVIIVPDQGIQNGEHRWDYKAILFEETVNAALWWRCPGMTHHVDTNHVVSTVDLMSTIMDMAGWPNAIPHNGKSFLPLFMDPNLPASAYSFALIENGNPNSAASRSSGIVELGAKYLEYGNGNKAFYRLPSPEDVNLATSTNPADVADRKRLAALLASERAK